MRQRRQPSRPICCPRSMMQRCASEIWRDFLSDIRDLFDPTQCRNFFKGASYRRIGCDTLLARPALFATGLLTQEQPAICSGAAYGLDVYASSPPFATPAESILAAVGG